MAGQGPYPQRPQQPNLGGNYPQRPYQGPPQQNIGGNYPRGPYQGPPVGPVDHQMPYGQAHPEAGVTPGLVTAGFILALIPCTSMLGIVLSAVGWGEAKKRQAGEKMAIAGIIIGVVWQVLGGLFWLIVNVADAAGSI
jgi:hypothetical protein